MTKRYYPKIQNWSNTKSVLTQLDIKARNRDGNKCVKCGKKTGLEVHHKIPEIEEIDNLITLCHSCHKKEHNMAGCFNKGVDSRRSKKGLLNGHKALQKLNENKFFNRHKGEWQEIKK